MNIKRCSVFCIGAIALSVVSGVSFAQVSPAITSASASYSAGAVTIDFASTGDFDRRQAMIDTDNNINTGFSGGYEILVENGYLYSYTGDGASWSWNSIGSASGSTGDQAFEQTVQWIFTLPAPPGTPVKFYIENDSLGASDELISTIADPIVNPDRAPVITSASSNYSADAITVNFNSSGDATRRLVLMDTDVNASTGYSGDRAFDLSVQWVFSIPDLRTSAPVRYYVENDNLAESDELIGIVTGDIPPPTPAISFTPQNNSDIFSNPDRGLYQYSVISIDSEHSNNEGFPLQQYTDDHVYCWNGQCGASDEVLRRAFNGFYANNFSLRNCSCTKTCK